MYPVKEWKKHQNDHTRSKYQKLVQRGLECVWLRNGLSPYDNSFEYGEDDDNNSVIIEGDEEELLDDDNYVGKLSAACDGNQWEKGEGRRMKEATMMEECCLQTIDWSSRADKVVKEIMRVRRTTLAARARQTTQARIKVHFVPRSTWHHCHCTVSYILYASTECTAPYIHTSGWMKTHCQQQEF